MPIEVISEIRPKNGGTFPLLDDAFLRGGFRSCSNLTERNSIPMDSRKEGMHCFVISTDTVYRLTSDLVTWSSDSALTKGLQDAYNGGAEIVTTSLNPVVIKGSNALDPILTIKNQTSTLAEFRGDGTVEVMETLTVRDYTSSIQVILGTNQTGNIDITDKTVYRAVQYFYTISNSDNSGFETGQLFAVHDAAQASLCAIIGSTAGISCGVVFSMEISGNNLILKAAADNSGSFSRVINLLKIVLV